MPILIGHLSKAYTSIISEPLYITTPLSFIPVVIQKRNGVKPHQFIALESDSEFGCGIYCAQIKHRIWVRNQFGVETTTPDLRDSHAYYTRSGNQFES